jgi:hypothetical protein
VQAVGVIGWRYQGRKCIGAGVQVRRKRGQAAVYYTVQWTNFYRNFRHSTVYLDFWETLAVLDDDLCCPIEQIGGKLYSPSTPLLTSNSGIKILSQRRILYKAVVHNYNEVI